MDDKILWDIIDGLRDEINIASDGITDLNDVIRDLQAERDVLKDQVNDLMIDKDRLVEQVSSNRGNSSSTHTHTIKKEIDDYMHHNPKCKMVKLFILPCEEFDEDGEYEGGCLYWDDGIV